MGYVSLCVVRCVFGIVWCVMLLACVVVRCLMFGVVGCASLSRLLFVIGVSCARVIVASLLCVVFVCCY